MHTCGGCDAAWTGLAICHCGACHETFSRISNFDLHRRGGKCVDPSLLALKRNSRGVWISANGRFD